MAADERSHGTNTGVTGRDPYVDFLRAASLVVVVIWHWMFTILIVSAESVSPSNPIGFTKGMWVMTWVFQVMPVFFGTSVRVRLAG